VYWPGAGSAMTTHDSRVFIANRLGRFFQVELSGAGELVRRIPLTIDTNYESLLESLNRELQEEASIEGSHGLRYVGLTDLLVLSDRPALAAAYTYWNGSQKCVTSRVALLDIGQGWHGGSGNWRPLFESAPCIRFVRHQSRGNQAGGRLVEVAPGKLYLGLGDFGHDGVVNSDVFSQDPAVSYGKIIEIDVDTRESRIIATGVRDPEGLARDSNGHVWSTEPGPFGGDELNLIRAGRNYGWPYATLGTNFKTHVWPLSRAQGRHDGYEEPAFAWTPSIDVSNLTAVHNFTPEWNGDLLVLSLAGNRLIRLRLTGDRVVLAEPIVIGDRLRDVGQLADGRIVLWTDTAKLILLSVEPGRTTLVQGITSGQPPAP
jgi:glucose/arabinose dehydrogenase